MCGWCQLGQWHEEQRRPARHLARCRDVGARGEAAEQLEDVQGRLRSGRDEKQQHERRGLASHRAEAERERDERGRKVERRSHPPLPRARAQPEEAKCDQLELEEEVELEGRAELLILLIAAQERRVGANLGTGGGEREGVAQD